MDLIIDKEIKGAELRGLYLKNSLEKVLAQDKCLEYPVDCIIKGSRELTEKDLTLFDQFGNELLNIQDGVSQETSAVIEPYHFIHINKALANTEFRRTTLHKKFNSNNAELEIYIPLLRQNVEYVAYSVIKVPGFAESMNVLYRQCLIAAIILFIINGIQYLYIGKFVLAPIKLLHHGVQHVSDGNFSYSINQLRNDELGEVVLAFNMMTQKIREMQLDALGANPLTTLPGNHSIVKEAERRLAEKQEFVLLYVDLDNFKPYNDYYGFHKGDEMLLYTKRCLEQTGRDFDSFFLGHEGGDDFVAIIPHFHAAEYAEKVINCFDAYIKEFYEEEDRKNGGIFSKDRHGNERFYHYTSISMAGVTNKGKEISSYKALVSPLSEIKELVKLREGSAYHIDARLK